MKKGKARLLACLCILLVVCYSFGVLLPHSHEGIGETCAICAVFRLLRSVAAVAVLGTVSALSARMLCKAIRISNEVVSMKHGTLILQKVKLSS
ncbi:MAG: hypothetical protein ACI3VQ_01045 [Faecousia sp.]